MNCQSCKSCGLLACILTSFVLFPSKRDQFCFPFQAGSSLETHMGAAYNFGGGDGLPWLYCMWRCRHWFLCFLRKQFGAIKRAYFAYHGSRKHIDRNSKKKICILIFVFKALRSWKLKKKVGVVRDKSKFPGVCVCTEGFLRRLLTILRYIAWGKIWCHACYCLSERTESSNVGLFSLWT